MYKVNKILFSFLFIFSLFSIVYILFFAEKNISVVVLPFTFLITTPILNLILKSERYPLTSYIFIFLSFFRSCFLPFLGVFFHNNYVLNDNLSEYLNLGLSLMVYEHIFLSIFLYFITRKSALRKEIKVVNGVKLFGSKSFYVSFIILSFLLYILLGRSLNIFDFGMKSIGTGVRGGDVTNTNTLIIREFILWGLYFSFFIVTEYYRKKYSQNSKTKYVYISLLFAFLLINVIVGERRSQQLFMGFATCITLISVFPHYTKMITRNIIIVVLIALVILSVYKYFNAFMYDNYLTAIKNTEVNTLQQLTLFDQSFNGVNSLLLNLNFLDQNQLSFSNFSYDILRNIFGLHFLFKGDNLTTTELYNYKIYYGEQITGYLFTGIAYGYAYGGFILAPFFTSLNLLFSSFLEKKLKNALSIEFKFVVSILLIRIALGIYTSPPPQINMVTRTLFIFGILYFFSLLFSGKLKLRTV